MARRTPVYEAHRGLDPRWTEFSGWEMPLSYPSIAEEHRAVREHCGLTPLDLTSLRPFGLAEGLVAGFPVVVCRTGYTGEDGFELLVEAAAARELWDALLAAAMRRGGLPCGLGARDTLRLEAGLPLHGSDMDASTTPREAGLAWVVKLAKPRFIGRETLASQAKAGVARRLVGIELEDGGVPRHGQTVWHGGAPAGE